MWKWFEGSSFNDGNEHQKYFKRSVAVNADVDHVDLGSAKGTPSDIYVGTRDIGNN